QAGQLRRDHGLWQRRERRVPPAVNCGGLVYSERLWSLSGPRQRQRVDRRLLAWGLSGGQSRRDAVDQGGRLRPPRAARWILVRRPEDVARGLAPGALSGLPLQ